jgi:formate/nitrite transporter
MSDRMPPEIADAAVASGVTKVEVGVGKLLVGSFLAGAYIAFGGLVAIAVSSGLNPQQWGTLPTLFTGTAFALGLVLVVVAGSHLLTGNMMLVPIGALAGRISARDVAKNLTIVTIGNLAGSLFVAYFLAVQSGVIGGPNATPGTGAALMHTRLLGIAEGKGVTETAWQIFLRAVGCNWLVCLAVWMSLGAKTISGKILAIFFPIMAFVALGFDHVVANMFFLPAAIFAGDPNLGWDDTLRNWLFAFLGNLVGAVVFVSTSYWYMYIRDEEPAAASAASTTEASR